MPHPFTPHKQSYNLQIRDVIDAIADADPDLFDNDDAILMPVNHRDKLDITICNSKLGETIHKAETHSLRETLMAWARLHADDMARYWCELLADMQIARLP